MAGNGTSGRGSKASRTSDGSVPADKAVSNSGTGTEQARAAAEQEAHGPAVVQAKDEGTGRDPMVLRAGTSGATSGPATGPLVALHPLPHHLKPSARGRAVRPRRRKSRRTGRLAVSLAGPASCSLNLLVCGMRRPAPGWRASTMPRVSLAPSSDQSEMIADR